MIDAAINEVIRRERPDRRMPPEAGLQSLAEHPADAVRPTDHRAGNILDTDVASASAPTRADHHLPAATAMLAQANQVPRDRAQLLVGSQPTA